MRKAKRPIWVIILRVLALLAGLGLAYVAAGFGALASDGPNIPGSVLAINFAPALALLAGALLAPFKPTFALIAFVVAVVFGLMVGIGIFSLAALLPAALLLPTLIVQPE